MKTKWKIQPGHEYDKLIPVTKGEDILVKKGSKLEDTMELIPQVVYSTLEDTRRIAFEVCKADTLYDTCRNIWYFVKDHIPYVKDPAGKEVISRPATTWKYRHEKPGSEEGGEDCDGYSTFISSLLVNLGILHCLRIAQYWYTNGEYAHIYVIVPTSSGDYITLDCVPDEFNHEENFTKVKDYKMELHYLNGIEGPEELGRTKRKILQKTGKIARKVLHATNKVNPATTLIREGLLLGMKTNFMKVAEKLRFAYMSDAEAVKRGFEMERFAKLKRIKDKLESIFHSAGGEPKNLKNAILTGRGNRSNEVSGLGVVTEAALTAASGILASIAALIKGIGNLKGKKGDGTEGKDDGTSTSSEPEVKDSGSDNSGSSTSDSGSSQDNSNLPAPTDRTSDSEKTDAPTTDPPKEESYWDKNKGWIIPTGIGVGVVATAIAVAHRSKEKEKQETPVQGIEQKHRKRRRRKKKNKHLLAAVKLQ